jgi:hypothetical protein
MIAAVGPLVPNRLAIQPGLTGERIDLQRSDAQATGARAQPRSAQQLRDPGVQLRIAERLSYPDRFCPYPGPDVCSVTGMTAVERGRKSGGLFGSG